MRLRPCSAEGLRLSPEFPYFQGMSVGLIASVQSPSCTREESKGERGHPIYGLATYRQLMLIEESEVHRAYNLSFCTLSM